MLPTNSLLNILIIDSFGHGPDFSPRVISFFHPRDHLEVCYRMHEANVQRAIKEARRKLGISVLPHELRYGYATHCLETALTRGPSNR